MSKTIIVAGYGPGSSKAIAEKFGAEGFAVALVARNAERLAAGVASLKDKGVRAEAFTADLGSADAVRDMVRAVRGKLGAIDVIQWSAYGGAAGDVTTADAAGVRGIFDVAITGLVTAVQEALPDLRANKGAVLVTNGGFGLFDNAMDKVGVQYNAMGLSIANSAKHKLTRMLAVKLAADGVFVGEVMVNGVIKGSAFDSSGTGNLAPAAIAAKYWDLYMARTTTHVTVA